MQIVINTINGTWVVPSEKEASLIMWLQQNAVRVGSQQQVREQQTNNNYNGQQLLNE